MNTSLYQIYRIIKTLDVPMPKVKRPCFNAFLSYFISKVIKAKGAEGI